MESMNKLEQIKYEMLNFCVEFEKFEKSKFLIDAMHFQMFGKLICEDMRLSILLDKYRNAIGMKERGDSDEDIAKTIKLAFTEVEKKYQQLCLKHDNLLKSPPISEYMNKEYLERVEVYFEDKCSKCHPLLSMNTHQDLERAWKFFVYFYQNNNLEGMKQLGQAIENYQIDESMISDNELITYYEKTMKEGRLLMQQQTTVYPYTAKIFVEDEMAEAAKTGELRSVISEKNSKLSDMKNRYNELFGEVEVF